MNLCCDEIVLNCRMYAKTGHKQHMSRSFVEGNCSTQGVGAGPARAVTGELQHLGGEDAVKCLPLADDAVLAAGDEDLGGVDAGVVVGG